MVDYDTILYVALGAGALISGGTFVVTRMFASQNRPEGTPMTVRFDDRGRFDYSKIETLLLEEKANIEQNGDIGSERYRGVLSSLEVLSTVDHEHADFALHDDLLEVDRFCRYTGIYDPKN